MYHSLNCDVFETVLIMLVSFFQARPPRGLVRTHILMNSGIFGAAIFFCNILSHRSQIKDSQSEPDMSQHSHFHTQT